MEMITDIKLRVTEALNSSYVSIEILNKYREALQNALDEKSISDSNEDLQKELDWRKVTELFDIQSKDVNQTNMKFDMAK